jgi:hypothetical protein
VNRYEIYKAALKGVQLVAQGVASAAVVALHVNGTHSQLKAMLRTWSQ